MKAYIIKNNKLIAEVETDLASGEAVYFSSQRVKEYIDANREYNLVNSSTGKISRAKKYEKEAIENECYGTEINSREFYIY